MVGKVFTGNVRPGQQQTGGDPIERIERVGTIAPLPTDPQPTAPELQPAEEFGPVGSSPIGQMLAAEGLIDELGAGVDQGRQTETTPAAPSLLEEEQRERERVEPFFDRAGIRDVPFDADIDDAVIENNPYLGAVNRADRLQNVFDAAAEGPTISALLTGTVPGTDTKRIDALNEGDSESAFRDLEITASRVLNDPAILDATVQNPDTGFRTVDPGFVRIMGLATEAFMVDHGSIQGVDFEETLDGDIDEGPANVQAGLKKAKGNARLGKAIWQEWQREKNVQQGLPSDAYIESAPPSGETNEFIGAMAKEAYALANPNVIERVRAGNQVEFQLKNPELIRQAQNAGQANPFANTEVSPLNQPSPSAQPQFEGKTYTRPEVTKVGRQAPGKMRVMEEARQNYHEMAVTVDPRRLQILLNMAIPGLKAVSGVAGQRQPSIWADMIGVGKAKYDAIAGEKTRLEAMAARYDKLSAEADTGKRQQIYAAKAAEYARRADEYDTEAVYSSEVAKALESLNTAARYQNQANYLTYAIQMLTGRMHVQQNRFNPAANKLIRFVSGHGDRTTIVPGSNSVAERNFKELATIFLPLDGKLLQPQARIKAFDQANLDMYAAMGRDLKANLADTTGAAAALAGLDTSQGINVPPAVGAISEPALRPETVEFLKKHKTEAPYIAEFLMDFADYHEGKTIHTAAEVEMDGITHGISTNGIALGIQSMAERAGAIQYSPDQKLITEDGMQGDIRAGMKDFMTAHGYSIAENLGYADKSNILNDILHEAIQDRENYLKKSPMTLAYGQEIQNLRQHVEAAVFTGPTSKQIAELAADNDLDLDHVTDYLFEALVQSLHHALDPRVLEMGQLLRANNTIAMITNDVIKIESPAGFDQFIGAVSGTGKQDKKPLSYTEADGTRKEIPVTTYEQAPSGSALRPQVGPDGEVSFTPGGWGRGRIIPAVVQGYDGNMIARTGSGQSFKRIKDIAKTRGQSGNFQPIFDAFKVSVGMMDVIRNEANQNWINGLQSKNYFHSVDEWARNSFREWSKQIKALPPGTKLDLQGEYRGLGWLMDQQNLSRHLASTLDLAAKARYDKNPVIGRGGKPIEFHQHIANEITNELRKAGILRFKGPVPDTITAEQAVFVANTIVKHMQLNGRNGKMRSDIDRDSKKLFSKINPRNVLQVDLG